MIDFSKIKWSEWMEDTIQHMVEGNVDRAVVVAFSEDGCTYVSYSGDICIHDLALAGFWLTDEAHRGAQEDEEEDEDK